MCLSVICSVLTYVCIVLLLFKPVHYQEGVDSIFVNRYGVLECWTNVFAFLNHNSDPILGVYLDI